MSHTDVQTVNINVTQGDCKKILLSFYSDAARTIPKDVSGWSLYSEIRELYDSTAVLDSWTFTQTGYASNEWLMELSATQTFGLPELPATSAGRKNINKLSYDLKAVIDDGCTYTIQQGAIYVTPEVTKI